MVFDKLNHIFLITITNIVLHARTELLTSGYTIKDGNSPGIDSLYNIILSLANSYLWQTC